MGGMDSQYKLLSELLSDQAAFITSPKTSLANYWGGIAPLPPSVYGPELDNKETNPTTSSSYHLEMLIITSSDKKHSTYPTRSRIWFKEKTKKYV